MLKLMGKKYLQFNAENFCLSKPVVHVVLLQTTVIQPSLPAGG